MYNGNILDDKHGPSGPAFFEPWKTLWKTYPHVENYARAYLCTKEYTYIPA